LDKYKKGMDGTFVINIKTDIEKIREHEICDICGFYNSHIQGCPHDNDDA